MGVPLPVRLTRPRDPEYADTVPCHSILRRWAGASAVLAGASAVLAGASAVLAGVSAVLAGVSAVLASGTGTPNPLSKGIVKTRAIIYKDIKAHRGGKDGKGDGQG